MFYSCVGPLVIHVTNNKLFATQSPKDGSRDSEVRKICFCVYGYGPFSTEH